MMNNKVQLITYADRAGCQNIAQLNELLQNEWKDIFFGVHLLPFFYPVNGEDAGFDPIDHLSVDKKVGSWDDISQLCNDFDVMADLIVNHISSHSEQFRDFLKKGNDSDYSGMFLTLEKVFPQGATESDLITVYRPRPGLPFTRFRFDDGSEKLLWTTFTGKQIDIDVNSNKGNEYLYDILKCFARAGIRIIRLDAAGYAIKKAGSSCFMTDETFRFIADFTGKAHALGMEVLVEVHSHYQTQIRIAKEVDYVYDFALPALVLHTLFTKDSSSLKKWLDICPANAFTVLDTHDGIGIIDVGPEEEKPGLINNQDIDKLVSQIHLNAGNESLKATGEAASNLDLYQVNCTFYSALGKNDRQYLLARAIQFFAPGIPQVYYVGFLAGVNDMELLHKTRVGRDINRHFYSREEMLADMKRPVVKSLIQLIRFRNAHPAFNGTFKQTKSPDHQIDITWVNNTHFARLQADLKMMSFQITFDEEDQIKTLAL
jgi:sucrose phosphorylase